MVHQLKRANRVRRSLTSLNGTELDFVASAHLVQSTTDGNVSTVFEMGLMQS